MSAPRIRACRHEELDQVLRFWAEHAAAPSPTDDIEGLEALYARDPEALLVAEESAVIVGTVIAAWDGWRGGVYRVVVSQSHRRGGLGRALVRAAALSLQTRGARRVAALVDADDAQAMAFWSALADQGFAHDRKQTRFTRTVA